MTRVFLPAATLAVGLLFIPLAAQAQSSGKSPGELAAASELLAKKYDDCRHEAKDMKLSFVQRRIYIHKCVRK